mmetsp:Transcript_6739/g.15598  ORF Transcript_6739/g.15598 Transcript_6739/m.15598 type:complete len:571 (-) Transcript_6739:84-1796(-)
MEEESESESDPLGGPSAGGGPPLDDRILTVVRLARKDADGLRRVTPAHLSSELGLSVEDATRELCGLLAAVGSGAGFVFERVEMPTVGGDAPDGTNESAGNESEGKAAPPAATAMVFTFPDDFERLARRSRRSSDWKRRLSSSAAALVRALKVFTAFGLVISLAVLIVAAICVLVAALVAMARGGGNGHHRNGLMHRVRYLSLQLRSMLWLYAICGSAVDGNQDPFLREVAGDAALMLSLFCGNPMHPFFWFRVGGMRRRWARVRRGRGWGGVGLSSWSNGNGGGTWNEERRSSSSSAEQRGLLSMAVEFLFGPEGDEQQQQELEKWKFRAAIILALSSSTGGQGVALRDLLPYVDGPPVSAESASAVGETIRIVAYFNGRPVESAENGSGIDARFCFPEIVSEMDYQKVMALADSEFSPPIFESGRADLTTILYREESHDFGGTPSAEVPEYLHERPHVLTGMSREHFGRCVLLGILNLVGLVWVKSAVMPGGLLQLPTSFARGKRKKGGNPELAAAASWLVIRVLSILRFYAGFFLLLPILRLVVVLIRNHFVARRNDRRRAFVRANI